MPKQVVCHRRRRGRADDRADRGTRSGARRVLMLERNEKLGKKIYITGKGRCNVTNLCTPQAFMQNVVRNPKFLCTPRCEPSRRRSIGRDLLHSTRLPHGRLSAATACFPKAKRQATSPARLQKAIEALGVSRCALMRVCEALIAQNGAITGVRTGKRRVQSPRRPPIVCTGGVSYPSTGSTGDGYELLKSLGHTIVPPKAALCGLISEEAWIRALQGLSLKNVRLSLWDGKKPVFSEIGEMLFTHRGISGPLVLTASSLMAGRKGLTLTLDLKPGLSEEQLDTRLLRDLAAAGKKQMLTILRGLYPGELAPAMAKLADIDPQTPASELTKAARQTLVSLTKALPLPVTGAEPIETAVITAGGADVKAFNPSTMESKLVKGLYAAGEVLDVDALTGGFNLHIAFATGYAAANAAAYNEE